VIVKTWAVDVPTGMVVSVGWQRAVSFFSPTVEKFVVKAAVPSVVGIEDKIEVSSRNSIRPPRFDGPVTTAVKVTSAPASIVFVVSVKPTAGATVNVNVFVS